MVAVEAGLLHAFASVMTYAADSSRSRTMPTAFDFQLVALDGQPLPLAQGRAQAGGQADQFGGFVFHNCLGYY